MKSEVSTLTFEEYFDLMTMAGFSPEEINLCWQSSHRLSILFAFINNN